MTVVPEVWDEVAVAAHFEECPERVELAVFGERERRFLCGCGEVHRHSPEGVARAELDATWPPVL